MGSTQPDTKCAGSAYKHQPLDIDNHQIRLLKLRSPSEHTKDYRLMTFDYGDDPSNVPSYVALSYTWGDERPTRSISIDGKTFEIRMNLFNFLSTHKTTEYLWIDQICIDQSDDEEKARQVKSMWKIYSRCEFVLVWLRNESTYTPSTKQAALDFNNGVQSYPKQGRREKGSSDDKTFLEWPTLAVLHNSYFERLWIVQELLLSKNVRVLVEGDVEVSWKTLGTKHEEIWGATRKMLPSTSWMMDAQCRRFLFEGYTSVNVTNYTTTTVGKFYDKKCENPKDKVYGLMALVQPASKVEIDYKKSIQRVYLDALMSMIKEHWYMRHDTPEKGRSLFRVIWPLVESKTSSLGLAQAMGLTDLEMSGVRSFVECIWERVDQDVVKTEMLGLKVDAETPCITSVGFDPKTHQFSRNERLAATCDRWWYEFEGRRHYHNCMEWSGNAKLQEYIVSRKGLREATYVSCNE